MKPLEITKQKVRNAIKSYLILGVLFYIVLFNENVYAQKVRTLNKEQYLIVNSIFQYSSEKQIKLNRNTLEYESWMNFIRTTDFDTLEIIGYCLIMDFEFEKVFNEFKSRMSGLQMKRINSKELDEKFKIKKIFSKNVSSISEPIIINEFSFQFIKSFYGKALNVQKKNDKGNWDYLCEIFFPTNLD